MAKPAVPFLGRPLIAHTLQWLERAGVTDVVLNLHHAPETVRRAVAESGTSIRIQYSLEPRLLGTGGALVNARPLLGDTDPILVVNGDAFLDAPAESIGRLLREHAEHGPMATLWLSQDPILGDIANVDVRPNGQIHRIAGRPSTADGDSGGPTVRSAYLGIQAVRPQYIDALARRAQRGVACARDDGWVPMLERGDSIRGVVLEGLAFDLGTPARYLDAHAALLDRAPTLSGWPLRAPGVSSADPLPPGLTLRPPVVIGPGLSLSGAATVGPYAVLGADVALADGAVVEHSVVWDGESISGRLERAIAGAGHVVRG